MTEHYAVQKTTATETADGAAFVLDGDGRVSLGLVNAVHRIGAWAGNVFAVWTADGRDAALEAQRTRRPDALYTVTDSGDLLQLADRYLEFVVRIDRATGGWAA